jgi:hypothetical protein
MGPTRAKWKSAPSMNVENETKSAVVVEKLMSQTCFGPTVCDDVAVAVLTSTKTNEIDDETIIRRLEFICRLFN